MIPKLFGHHRRPMTKREWDEYFDKRCPIPRADRERQWAELWERIEGRAVVVSSATKK